jgi:hypothetical protein
MALGQPSEIDAEKKKEHRHHAGRVVGQKVITFDQTNFEYQGEKEGVLTFSTPKGDELGLFHFAIPPDIEADINDEASLRATCRRRINEAGLGVIEVEPCVVDNCRAVRTLFKVAQPPTGRTYLGALTIPFRDFSYVLKVQCVERGITGWRDTRVMYECLATGKVKIDSESREIVGWLDDPYDPQESGPMTRNLIGTSGI